MTDLVTALMQVIDEIREGAKFDARWEDVEKAYDRALAQQVSLAQQIVTEIVAEEGTRKRYWATTDLPEDYDDHS